MMIADTHERTAMPGMIDSTVMTVPPNLRPSIPTQGEASSSPCAADEDGALQRGPRHRSANMRLVGDVGEADNNIHGNCGPSVSRRTSLEQRGELKKKTAVARGGGKRRKQKLAVSPTSSAVWSGFLGDRLDVGVEGQSHAGVPERTGSSMNCCSRGRPSG
jgi:hypothetical protein